jgi:RimJ/RimL family protein N-acetyltransferase
VKSVSTSPPYPLDAPENLLSDGVVSLRPFTPADALTLMQLDADPDIQHWFDWPLTPAWDDAATYEARLASADGTIRGKRASWAEGTQFAFIIDDVETKQGLGWIDLQPRESGRGSVAYGLLPAFRRKGVATRSVLLATRYAFDSLNWDRLEIAAIADNAASRRVAVKAAFHLEGVLRSYGAFERHQPVLGQRYDWAIYGRVRTEQRYSNVK